MQNQFKLIKPGSSVLDLGCAPGAWLQVACQSLGPLKNGGVVVGVDIKEGLVVEAGFVYNEETHLTIKKTSLFFVGDDFTVYDCKGELIFRVDSYDRDYHDRDELVLMELICRVDKDGKG